MVSLRISTWTHNPLISKEDSERTLSKLFASFVFAPVLSLNDILKVVITDVDKAEVYTRNGCIYYYSDNSQYRDRLQMISFDYIESEVRA